MDVGRGEAWASTGAPSKSVNSGWGEGERGGLQGLPFTLLPFLPGKQVWVCDPWDGVNSGHWEEGSRRAFHLPKAQAGNLCG